MDLMSYCWSLLLEVTHGKYLLQYHHSALNWFLQAVLSDLKVSHHNAGVKALRIIDKVVTGTFWRYLN